MRENEIEGERWKECVCERDREAQSQKYGKRA